MARSEVVVGLTVGDVWRDNEGFIGIFTEHGRDGFAGLSQHHLGIVYARVVQTLTQTTEHLVVILTTTGGMLHRPR